MVVDRPVLDVPAEVSGEAQAKEPVGSATEGRMSPPGPAAAASDVFDGAEGGLAKSSE